MKFTCKQNILSKALNIVSKGVTNKNTIPILKGILLKIEDNNTLILTASDLDLTIETKIEVDSYENGSIVVFSKLFTEIIRKLPNEEIEIEVDENNNINIKCSNSEFNIVGQPSEEYPNINENEDLNEIHLNKEIFKDMIKKVYFSASTEEARGILTGVLIEIKKEYINMVALDGYRMATAKTKIKNKEERKIVISSKIINEIYKILSEDEENEIKVCADNKKMIIKSEKLKIITRLMEGEYINYESIFPKEKKCSITVVKEDLFSSIERASLLVREGKNNLIKMNIEEDKIIISSRSDEGKVKEEVFVEKQGENIEIGFNSKYITDILKVITEEEKIIMEFNTNVNPCVIMPEEGEEYKYLLLPVRISGN